MIEQRDPGNERVLTLTLHSKDGTGTGNDFMVGQAYVERLWPQGGVRQQYSLIFIHGGAQTGTVRRKNPTSCYDIKPFLDSQILRIGSILLTTVRVGHPGSSIAATESTSSSSRPEVGLLVDLATLL